MIKTSSSIRTITEPQTYHSPPQEIAPTTSHFGDGDGDDNDSNAKNDHKGIRSDDPKRKNEEKGTVTKRDDIKNEDSNKEKVCVIDVKNEDVDDEKESEKICRICQLGSDHLSDGNVENDNNVRSLVLLGCACKGELGLSHYHCALTWFHQKGNRTCEICGKSAKNIHGIEDTGFRAFGAENISIISSGEIVIISDPYERNHRWTKSLCNFLLVILVLAFLLPWAIHPSRLL